MQVYNMFLLMLSAVLILLCGIFAKKESKGHTLRTVAGLAAPFIMLSIMCLAVEMIVAGYAETAELFNSGLTVKNYLFPRHAFTAVIVLFILLTALSAALLKSKKRINPTAAFFGCAAVTLIAAAVLICISSSEQFAEHGLVIIPAAILFALSEIFALADTLLDTDKKHRTLILYAVNIAYCAVAAFILWFVQSSGLSEELQYAEGHMTAGAIAVIVIGIILIAGPPVISLLSLVSKSVSGYKYAKKDKSPSNKG